MKCSRFQIGCVIVEYDLFNTTTFIHLGYARFGIILCFMSISRDRDIRSKRIEYMSEGNLENLSV